MLVQHTPDRPEHVVHSDITVTLDTYTHLGLEDAAEEMKRLAEVEQARKEQEKLNQKRDDDEAGTIVAI